MLSLKINQKHRAVVGVESVAKIMYYFFFNMSNNKNLLSEWESFSTKQVTDNTGVTREF